MKKVFMSIMAFAAVALTMTSCNKEEAITASNFNVSFEDTEVMNDVKTHFVGHDQVFDQNDVFYIMDGSANIAHYRIDLNANPNYIFDRAVRGSFDQNNGVLTAFYPTKIVYNNNVNEVLLPAVQKTNAGEIQWPLYAQGTVNDFYFRNLCANHAIYLSGDVALDSITVTTNNYINGFFKVNFSNLTNPLTYGQGTGTSRNSMLGHGTRTYTLRFNSPFQLTNEEQLVRLTVPAGEYSTYIITFYANGKKRTLSNPANVTFERTVTRPSHVELNLSNFVDFVPGALAAEYNVAGEGEAPKMVIFSQGNLEYLGLGNHFWRFSDNQFDFRGRYQSKIQNQYDRDLFAWGANGYFKAGSLVGNGIKIWGANNDFGYSTATELTGTSEWGNNKIANAGNTANSGWRTLTEQEMNNLLANYAHAMVTLGFNNKTGLVIFADGATAVPDGTVLTKSQWNALQNAGCVFFVADNYRAATGTIENRIPAAGAGSYFWLNNGDANSNTASALYVDKVNGATVVNNVPKNVGAFVRLVKEL